MFTGREIIKEQIVQLDQLEKQNKEVNNSTYIY